MIKTCSNCWIEVDKPFIHDRELGYKRLCDDCEALFNKKDWEKLSHRAIQGWRDFCKRSEDD